MSKDPATKADEKATALARKAFAHELKADEAKRKANEVDSGLMDMRLPKRRK